MKTNVTQAVFDHVSLCCFFNNKMEISPSLTSLHIQYTRLLCRNYDLINVHLVINPNESMENVEPLFLNLVENNSYRPLWANDVRDVSNLRTCVIRILKKPSEVRINIIFQLISDILAHGNLRKVFANHLHQIQSQPYHNFEIKNNILLSFYSKKLCIS